MSNTLSATEQRFIRNFQVMSDAAYKTGVAKGWYGPDGKKVQNIGERIALMHSELSEALEAVRHGNLPDDKIPEFTGLEAELADVIIRIGDFSAATGLRVGEAVVAKMRMNAGRPYLHGGKNF